MSTALLSNAPDPGHDPAVFAPAPGQIAPLTGPQKAAIIVRLIMGGEHALSLEKLPEKMQQDLTMQMSTMRSVSREQVNLVVQEFMAHLDDIGLSFADGLEGALNTLSGSINAQMAERLRREGGVNRNGDPWQAISAADNERLLPILEGESIEVAAVLLSKLQVSKAAELLGMLPGPHARRITYAISLTSAVTPDAVRRIGQSVAAQLDSLPPQEFTDDPVERIGAILNFSAANTRDEVLDGLEKDDEGFASQVRKAIFTFANIPTRIDPRDAPKITRGIDQGVLVTALAYAAANDLQDSSDFILENISKRMADSLREEMQELGNVKDSDGEAAMSQVVAEIRELEAAGEIFFIFEEG